MLALDRGASRSTGWSPPAVRSGERGARALAGRARRGLGSGESLAASRGSLAPGGGLELSVAPAPVRTAVTSPGRQLDRGLRSGLESRFGHDFSRVRVVTGPEAEAAAASVGARAFTAGNRIVFGAGQLDPHSSAGQDLLAHELAHVVQQEGRRPVLQRQAVDEDEEAVRAEVETDRRRFEEARKGQKAALEPLPLDKLKTDTFRKQGLTTRRRIGKKTGGQIQSALMASRALRPYIGGKLRSRQIARNFVIHSTDAEFESVYVRLHKINVGDPYYGRRLTVGGFYHADTDTIHLRGPSSRLASSLGDTVHEAIHKFSSSGSGRGSLGFLHFFGGFLNEGVTQFFTDVLLQEQGLGIHTRHKYGKQLRCAKAVVDAFGVATVGRAYFMGEIMELTGPMARRLNIQLIDFNALRKGDALCKSLRKAGIP